MAKGGSRRSARWPVTRLNAGDDTSDAARRSIATRGPSHIPAFYPRRSRFFLVELPCRVARSRAILDAMPALPGNSRLVVRAVGSETIVYDPRTHKAHCLGPEAAAVWRECDGHRSASEIAERMRLANGGPLDETSVAVALRRLERAGLVDGQVSRGAGGLEANGPGHGAGRRAALRRVATLAGLTVLSIAVPTPEAAAATCTVAAWQPCQTTAQCCPAPSGTTCCGTSILNPNQPACLPRWLNPTCRP